MFNPLKMSSDEKKMLLGGIASSLIYWGNYLAKEQPGYPAELKQQIDPHLPSNGDLLAGIAPPVALYAVAKYGKKRQVKEVADGSILFALPNMTARIITQAAFAEGRAASTARFVAPTLNMSKYLPTQPMTQARPASSGFSKYMVTS